jgi:putative ABC transport system permease protein
MRKRALRKDFYMEIKTSLNRFLSIFLIVALGVAFFAGLRATNPDMRLTADNYYDQSNLMDIRVLSTLGLTDEDVTAIAEVDGVKEVEPAYSTHVVCDADGNELVLEVLSATEKINKILISGGRMPQTETEVLVDNFFISNTGYKIGDKIKVSSGTTEPISDTLNIDEFTIVGVGSTSYYLSFQRGSSSIGSGDVNSFVVVLPEVFKQEAYTTIYASVEGALEMTVYTNDYDNKVEEVLSNIEDISEVRCQIRYEDIYNPAYEKILDARDELAASKTKIENSKKEIADSKAKIAASKEKIETSKKELKDSKAKLENSKPELEASKLEIQQSKELLADKREQLNKAKVSAMEEYNSNLEMLPYAGLTESQLNAAMAQLEQAYQGAQQEFEKAETQISYGETELAIAADRITAGEEEIIKAEDKIKDGEAKLADAEQEISEGEAKLAEGEEELAEGEIKYRDGEAEIADAKVELAKLEVPTWYVLDRGSIEAYVEFEQNADRIGAIGEVFPAIFFLVAALISLTTMTRMVEEERIEIGTLKALGYSKISIAKKYILYALLATLGGSLFGAAVGLKILPTVIISAYKIMYINIPEVITPFNIYYAGLATIIALLCVEIATFFACYKELQAKPAHLMRPEAPKAGKRVFLERLPLLWNKMNFTWKATIRNLMRYKKRFFMTIFGIGGCMSLLLVGFGLKDSIFVIYTRQFDEVMIYDATVSIDGEASQAQIEDLVATMEENEAISTYLKVATSSIDISFEGESKSLTMYVPQDVVGFEDYIVFREREGHRKLTLQEDGILLTEQIAKKLGIKVGDIINLTMEDEEVPVEVTGITENYMTHYVYLSPKLYEQLFDQEPDYNEYFMLMPGVDQKSELIAGNSLLEQPAASGVFYTSYYQDLLSNVLVSLDIVVWVLIISAGALAFVVLYNLNNININERRRELATLKVLGFYNKETAAYVYRENIILTMLGALLGAIMGIFLHRYVITTVEIDMVMFGRNIDPSSYVYSILLTLLFSVFVNFIMYFKLKKIDMVESLKSIE